VDKSGGGIFVRQALVESAEGGNFIAQKQVLQSKESDQVITSTVHEHTCAHLEERAPSRGRPMTISLLASCHCSPHYLGFNWTNHNRLQLASIFFAGHSSKSLNFSISVERMNVGKAQIESIVDAILVGFFLSPR